MPASKLIGMILGIVGVVCILLGLIFWSRTKKFLRTAVATEGQVVELVESLDSAGDGPNYAPRFVFRTADGREVSALSRVGSSPAGFQVKDRVKVLYDPSNPAEAKINSAFQVWGTACILLGIGIVFLGFAVWSWFRG